MAKCPGTGVSITGRVIDSDRKPVAGAMITARPSSAVRHSNLDAVWTEADEDGRFQLEGLTPGSFGLSCQAPDFTASPTQSIDVESEPISGIEFRLLRSVVYEGLVVNESGEPISGAQLHLWDGDQGHVGQTNADGHFEISRPVRVPFPWRQT